MSDRDVLRREFLGALGATAAAGLAGCSGGDESTESGSTSSTPQKTSQGNAQGSSGEDSQVTDQNSTDGGDDTATQGTQNSDLGAGEYPQSESEGIEAEGESSYSNAGWWGLEISNYDFLTAPDISGSEGWNSYEEGLAVAMSGSESVYFVVPTLTADANDVVSRGEIKMFKDGLENQTTTIDTIDPKVLSEGQKYRDLSESEAREAYTEFFRDHVNPEGRSKSVFAEEAVVDSFGTVPEYAREPLLSESSQ